jgi:hypothetical protein
VGWAKVKFINTRILLFAIARHSLYAPSTDYLTTQLLCTHHRAVLYREELAGTTIMW